MKELQIIEPKVFIDERGFFLESYNSNTFFSLIGSQTFVQDNHSCSKKGVLRGLHYQVKQPQGKLIRVIKGEIFDVAVDMRKSSPTFGKWKGIILSGENKKIFWVPEGFAHGFIVLSESADVMYKTTDFYCPEGDRSLLWSDPEIGIKWPEKLVPILSEKDRTAPCLKDAEYFS